MITYEQIEQANSKLSTVQLGTGSKKKDYVMVPQRVKAFRMLYPEGFILTDIISHENNVVVMQAKAGYYNEHGDPVILGTGLAFEEKGKGMVNGTSYIENCETSAVGRALGFLALGIDGGGICSAEELVNAITAQAQMQPYQRPQNQTPQGQVSTTASVPAQPEGTETGAAYIMRKMAEMKETMQPGFDFAKARLELIANGQVESIPSATISLEKAKALIAKMYEVYADQRKVS